MKTERNYTPLLLYIAMRRHRINMSIKEKHIKDDNEYIREKKELILSEKQEGLIELPFKRFIGLLHMED